MPSSTNTLGRTTGIGVLPTGSTVQRSSEELLKPTVAELCSKQVSRMSRAELSRVVLAGQLPFLEPSVRVRLEYLDRGTLERLAHLACQSCRNHGY